MSWRLEDERAELVAEAGVNHDGDLEQAFALVDAAVAAGADAVKFQSFRTDALVSAGAPKAPYQEARAAGRESQAEMLRRLELDAGAHRRLVDHCRAAGIEFMSSAFDEDSLRMLVEVCGVGRIKLGSGELTHGPLLLAAARTGLPLVVSTGMSHLAEVEEALAVLAFGMIEPTADPSREAARAALQDPEARASLWERVTLLHCTSAYPAPVESANLRALATLRHAFGLRVGYSDHTIGFSVPLAAVALGAVMIEKHLTLDKSAAGPDHAASADPTELRALAEGMREVGRALGDGAKRVQPCEAPQRRVARRSVVAARPLPAGTVLQPEDLAIKRPAGGCSPMDAWALPGRVLLRDHAADEPLDCEATTEAVARRRSA